MAPSRLDDGSLLSLAPVPLFIPVYNCTSLTCLFTDRACTPWPSHPDSPWLWPCSWWPCRSVGSPPVNCVQEQHWEFQKWARLMKTSHGEWTEAGDGAWTSQQSPVRNAHKWVQHLKFSKPLHYLSPIPHWFLFSSFTSKEHRLTWLKQSLYLCLLKAGNNIGLLTLFLCLPPFRQSLANNASSPTPLSLLFLF